MIHRTSNNADYYKNPKKYEELTAIIDKLHFNEDGTIYLTPNTDTYPHASYWEINSDNAQIAIINGFDKEVKVGDEITIVSAYGFTSPGFYRTIVAVKKGSKVYFDLKTGIENQIDNENESYSNYLLWILIPCLATLSCWLISYFLVIRK